MTHPCRPLLALASAFLGTALQAAPSSDFKAFESQFRAAVLRNDAGAIAALSRLPFLFDGRPHDREAFVRQVWPQLFSAPLRRCLAQAPFQRDGAQGNERVLFCRPYSFHFDASDGVWRLREFAADGEDAP